MSHNNLPFSHSALDDSLDDLDVKSVNVEQDEKAENAKEKEPSVSRLGQKRIMFYNRTLKKMTHPFLSDDNEKDPVLLRSISKHLPFTALYNDDFVCKWQRVADDCNAAKSVSTGQPLFEREVTARACKDRFMNFMNFIKEYKEEDNKQESGEILTAIKNIYEEYKTCVEEGKERWKKKRKISGCSQIGKKKIAVDNDVLSKDEDSSSNCREKARMLREQNIARKLKLKAFELKLKEKALMMKEEQAEHRRKENKERRDEAMKMFNSFQTQMCNSLQKFMSTMESTTHGTTSTSLPKVDDTVILADRNKNGPSCESEDDNDDNDDDDLDDDSSNSTPSHYCLP